MTTIRKSPNDRTINGKVSTKRMGRTKTLRNVSTRIAAIPEGSESISRPGTIMTARKTAMPVMRTRMAAARIPPFK